MTKKVLGLLAFAAAVPLLAQVQSGRIVGTVTDPIKAVSPNAQVTVANKATNQSIAITTNGAGDYAVTPLDPGVYNVRVTAAGFQTTIVDNVEVLVGQSARADVELRVGETTASVDVD